MGLRRPEDHYTYSKVMASVALDRADQTAIAKQLPGDVDRWRSYAASIRRLVLDRGGVTSAERSCSRSRGRPARRRQPPLPAGWFASSQRPAPELGGDSPRPQAGVAEREGNDPLLAQRQQLIRHPRPPALAGAQDLEPVPLDPAPPDVEGGTVDAEDAAGLAINNRSVSTVGTSQASQMPSQSAATAM